MPRSRARLRLATAVIALVLSACAQPGGTRAELTAAPDHAVAPDGEIARHTPTASSPVPAAAARTAPDLTGATVAELAALARDARLAVQVLAFDDAGTVTTQDPAPGAPLAADGAVLVWLGTPPPIPERRPQSVIVEVAELAAGSGAAPQAPAATDAPADPAAQEPETAPTPPSADTVRPGPDAGAGGPSQPRGPGIRALPPAPVGLVLSGRASWYGEELAGSPVACGGRFDPDAATLASRELRCGTHVRITGPTGAAVEAVVTDWGPATWTGKRFDLSRAVFAELAPVSRGWLEVDVEVVDPGA